MSKYKFILCTLLILFPFIGIYGQSEDDFNKLRETFKREHQQYRVKVRNEFDEYRKSVNEEYIEQLRKPWSPIQEKYKIKPIENIEPPLPPVIENDDDSIELIERPLPIDTIVLVPTPKPQPEPIYVIEEDEQQGTPSVNFVFYGTNIDLRGAEFDNLNLKSSNDNDVADGWQQLFIKENDNFIIDCLATRDKLNLPDWGFFKLVEAAVNNYSPPKSNQSTLIMAYVLTQCGYKIYLCRDNDVKDIHLLFVSDDSFTDRIYFPINGEKAYAYYPIPSERISYSQFKDLGNQKLSIALRNTPTFNYASDKMTVKKIVNQTNVELSCSPNKNLIDFYNDYPDGFIGSDVYSKWAIHGNTPLSNELKEALYPSLKSIVSGKNQYEAVNVLLKVAQSFPYGFDDEIWNRDRAFWPEETWYYPYSDCEDHAIHFTRLVRDILGLNAVLIYYPGHLSSAIEIKDGSQKGDYVVYQGKKYTVCDATYFYANAGITAPSNDNSSAVLIPLHK